MRARFLVFGILTGCARLFGIETVDLPPIDAAIDAAGPGPGRWVSVVGAFEHTCAISELAELWCWGRNDAGQLGVLGIVEADAPVHVGTAHWLEVAVYGQHTCGIQDDHSLWCWGDNYAGMLGIPSTNPVLEPTALAGTWQHVATGGVQNCAIAMDGSLSCAGVDNNGQMLGKGTQSTMLVLDPGPWTAIASSDATICGLKGAGELWCWGSDDYGQVGIPNLGAVVSTMQHVDAAEEPWRAIAMGTVTSCAITGDRLRCWGNNQSGQLGDETTNGRGMPAPVDLDREQWATVAVNGYTACGTTTSGGTMCWGDNRYLQLANPQFATYTKRTKPDPVPGSWSAIALGSFHTCAIDATTHAIACAGRGGNGALGDGATGSVTAPRQIMAADHVDVGYASSCAIAGDALSCWGFNAAGAIGDGSTFDRMVPVPISGNWRTVSVGAHTCAIATDVNNTLFCWGKNDSDEIGDSGAANPVLAPKIVGPNWLAVATSLDHTCAIGTSGAVYCWGANSNGQCGQAPSPKVGGPITPITPQNPGGFTAVATGDTTTCGVDAAGYVECWGAGGLGQLGDSTGTGRSAPMLTSGPIAAVSIGVGALFGCSANPNLYCWGYDDNGQLGNQTTSGTATPEVVPGSWIQVATGAIHACGVQADHSLWCWGDNRFGQLGDGTFYPEHMPVQIGTDQWQSVSAGSDHTCAVRSDNTVWCWGGNGSGQIGDGSAWRSVLMPTH